MEFRKRRHDISKKISTKRLDFVAITTEANLRYFFNYNGHSFERFCCGLISADGSKSALVIPKLDTGKAQRSSVDDVFSWTDSEGYKNALILAGKSVNAERAEKIGCEEALRLGQMEQFRNTLQVRDFVSITQDVSSSRMIKSEYEIDSIKSCATKLAKAYKIIPEIAKPGMTESDLAFEMMKEMSEQGLEKSEPPLVQSGINSAMPHSTPGAKKLQKGEMLVVDASSPNSDGYYADFTRTYSIGRASTKQKEVYEIVRKAQEKGALTPRLGTPAEEVDRTTRSIIEDAGYGEYFFHRTGHGLGLEVHEEPYIKEGNRSKLESGMVFTVEPGIYLSGKFGVRIEDNIIIGRSKAANVTPLDHELIEI